MALLKFEITPVVSRPQVNYSSPVVAVRFAGVQYDTHIQVQCKLNGKGIINDSPTDRYLGSVTFSLDVGAWGKRYRCQQDAPVTMRQENVQEEYYFPWNM